MYIEHRKENGDASPRLAAEAEPGWRYGIADRDDGPIGRCDGEAIPEGNHPRRIAKEEGQREGRGGTREPEGARNQKGYNCDTRSGRNKFITIFVDRREQCESLRKSVGSGHYIPL